VTRATVRSFNDEEGWGVLDAPEAPGGVFVHYSDIEDDDPNAYKTLNEGQRVEIDLEGPLQFEQDGFRYRATRVKPLP
jgi:CspA family cold shock protein